MNQPSDIIPYQTATPIESTANGATPDSNPATYTTPSSPLHNLLTRLRKSEGARRKTRGAFGGKTRSKRHEGLV